MTPWTVACQAPLSMGFPRQEHLEWVAISFSSEHHVSVQFSRSSCLILCDPMDCSTPGLPVHHQLSELTQTHVHRVGDAIQPSHPLSSPLPPTFNLSQHHVYTSLIISTRHIPPQTADCVRVPELMPTMDFVTFSSLPT